MRTSDAEDFMDTADLSIDTKLGSDTSGHSGYALTHGAVDSGGHCGYVLTPGGVGTDCTATKIFAVAQSTAGTATKIIADAQCSGGVATKTIAHAQSNGEPLQPELDRPAKVQKTVTLPEVAFKRTPFLNPSSSLARKFPGAIKACDSSICDSHSNIHQQEFLRDNG